MLQDLENIVTLSLTFEQILSSTLVAFLCGVLIAVLYRFVYRGTTYSDSFVHSLVLLSMITATVIMVIGSNLARAFGLVGAMSIIRFRTAVKDTQDIIFIFYSLAAGLAAGAGMHTIAITGTLLIGMVALLLSRSTFAQRKRREFLLQLVMGSTRGVEAPYLQLFDTYCKRTKLVNMKSFGEGESLELSFYVNLKDEEQGANFVAALRRLESVERVNLFYDEDHY